MSCKLIIASGMFSKANISYSLNKTMLHHQFNHVEDLYFTYMLLCLKKKRCTR